MGLYFGDSCPGFHASDSAYCSPSLTEGEIVICGIEASSHSWHCYSLADNRQVLCMQHINPSSRSSYTLILLPGPPKTLGLLRSTSKRKELLREGQHNTGPHPHPERGEQRSSVVQIMERRLTVLHKDVFSRQHSCLTGKPWGRWCRDCALLGCSKMGLGGEGSRLIPNSVTDLLPKRQRLGPSKCKWDFVER